MLSPGIFRFKRPPDFVGTPMIGQCSMENVVASTGKALDKEVFRRFSKVC